MPLSVLPGQCPGFEAVLFPAQISPFPGQSLPSCSLAQSHRLLSALGGKSTSRLGESGQLVASPRLGLQGRTVCSADEGRQWSTGAAGKEEQGGLGRAPRKGDGGEGDAVEGAENMSPPQFRPVLLRVQEPLLCWALGRLPRLGRGPAFRTRRAPLTPCKMRGLLAPGRQGWCATRQPQLPGQWRGRAAAVTGARDTAWKGGRRPRPAGKLCPVLRAHPASTGPVSLLCPILALLPPC